ncbi:hypothetical protein H6796_03240 [Candidatus Nomurabacteria bacterium]|nr:hypothetical protein [Candidatus Nomurabacteria bacterium]
MVLVPSGAAAIDLKCSDGGSGGVVCNKINSDRTRLPELVTSIVNILFYIVGVVAVIMIIVSGIKYTTANGDANKIQSAKNTLMYSVVGLIVAFLSFAIVNYVINNI